MLNIIEFIAPDADDAVFDEDGEGDIIVAPGRNLALAVQEIVRALGGEAELMPHSFYGLRWQS